MPSFKKLVYMLPAAILRTYEAAVAGPYIIVINRRGVHGIPFGEPMTEAYPQIFLPVGMQLLPHVDYDLLREHLQIRPDQNLYFFPEGKPAFSVGIDVLKPLSRAVVAPDRARASIIELKTQPLSEPLPAPVVTHKRQGAFSLWRGTRVQVPDASRALPAAGGTSGAPGLNGGGGGGGGDDARALPAAAPDATPPLGTTTIAEPTRSNGSK